MLIFEEIKDPTLRRESNQRKAMRKSSSSSTKQTQTKPSNLSSKKNNIIPFGTLRYSII